MIRAVFDTNVLVSALITHRGAPAALIGQWRAGVFELIVSPRLLGELTGVLAQKKFRDYVTPREIRSYESLLAERAVSAEDLPDPPKVSPDPDDDFLIAPAREGGAILVTGDDRLLGVRAPRLVILSPRAFLDVLVG